MDGEGCMVDGGRRTADCGRNTSVNLPPVKRLGRPNWNIEIWRCFSLAKQPRNPTLVFPPRTSAIFYQNSTFVYLEHSTVSGG